MNNQDPVGKSPSVANATEPAASTTTTPVTKDAKGSSGTMKKFMPLIQLVISRTLFIMHSLFVIWKTTQLPGYSSYWACTALYIFMLADMVYILLKGGYTNKYLEVFNLGTLFYIIATVPGIVAMELEHLSRIQRAGKEHTYAMNVTLTPNGTNRLVVIERLTFRELVFFHGDRGLNMLEQLFLIIFIAARWIMPKHKLTHNDLSKMLFVYTSIATDTMELFSLFQVKAIANSYNTSKVILAAYISSLFQFTLSLHYSPRKSRGGEFSDERDEYEYLEDEELSPETLAQRKVDVRRETYSLLASFFLMDAPYLIIRFYVVLYLHIVSYNIVFYFCKNTLLIIFTAYRFAVIYGMIPTYDEEEDNMMFYNDYLDYADYGESGEMGQTGDNPSMMGETDVSAKEKSKTVEPLPEPPKGGILRDVKSEKSVIKEPKKLSKRGSKNLSVRKSRSKSRRKSKHDNDSKVHKGLEVEDISERRNDHSKSKSRKSKRDKSKAGHRDKSSASRHDNTYKKSRKKSKTLNEEDFAVKKKRSKSNKKSDRSTHK